MSPEVQTIDCVPGQIMYNCFYVLGPMPRPPPPPSSLYPGQHHAYYKTLVALEDGQVVIKCHQHHQLLYKICYLYVTNVYSYVLMMQIKFVLYLYCIDIRYQSHYIMSITGISIYIDHYESSTSFHLTSHNP